MSYLGHSFSAPMFELALPHDGEPTPAGVNGILSRSRWAVGRDEEIAVISHELRNSLAVISSAARALALSPGTAASETAQSLIERHVKLMSRHIEDLLEPAHRGGDRTLKLLPVDLRLVARQAADSIAAEITRRGHRLAVTLPIQPVWALADGDRLGQVVANLLINAAKFTPDGGDIALIVERTGESLCIRIRDSGLGIEPAMLSRVFDLFVQSNPTRRSTGSGRGIGLALARNLVELHGGTVTAESAGLGKGSEFTVLLPARNH